MTAPSRTPNLKGLHHIKLPVADLDTSLAWYQRVFGATHSEQFDHYDGAGVRYAVILELPGLDTPVELRWAPHAAAVIAGYDPVSFVAGTSEDLTNWLEHLDSLGVDHSPVITALAGQLLIFRDPDGTFLRLLTLPDGGIQAIQMNRDSAAEPEGPWLMPDIMRHP